MMILQSLFVFIQFNSFGICNMLSSFFSNNLILNKASLVVFSCKWSAVAGVSFLGFGCCRSPGR